MFSTYVVKVHTNIVWNNSTHESYYKRDISQRLKKKINKSPGSQFILTKTNLRRRKNVVLMQKGTRFQLLQSGHGSTFMLFYLYVAWLAQRNLIRNKDKSTNLG